MKSPLKSCLLALCSSLIVVSLTTLAEPQYRGGKPPNSQAYDPGASYYRNRPTAEIPSIAGVNEDEFINGRKSRGGCDAVDATLGQTGCEIALKEKEPIICNDFWAVNYGMQGECYNCSGMTSAPYPRGMLDLGITHLVGEGGVPLVANGNNAVKKYCFDAPRCMQTWDNIFRFNELDIYTGKEIMDEAGVIHIGDHVLSRTCPGGYPSSPWLHPHGGCDNGVAPILDLATGKKTCPNGRPPLVRKSVCPNGIPATASESNTWGDEDYKLCPGNFPFNSKYHAGLGKGLGYYATRENFLPKDYIPYKHPGVDSCGNKIFEIFPNGADSGCIYNERRLSYSKRYDDRDPALSGHIGYADYGYGVYRTYHVVPSYYVCPAGRKDDANTPAGVYACDGRMLSTWENYWQGESIIWMSGRTKKSWDGGL